MAKNIVAVKQAGLLIATGWLDRAVKEAAYLGVAVVDDGKLVINHHPAKPTVDVIQKVQEHFKDSTVVFCFGENSKTSLEEDRLPFLCQLDKAKGDEVAVFLTGNFEGYKVKDSAHIDEYHCFDTFLSKKLPKLYKGAGGDIEKFLEELNDPITQQDFSNSWTNRGFLTFLASNGKQTTIYNKGNVFVQTFPWGTVSDGLNYVEKAADPPKEASKPMSLLENLLAKKKNGGSVPEVPAPKADTSTAAIAAAVSDTNWEDVSLPKEGHNWTNKQKIQWWVGEVGYKPDGYKDMKTKVRRTKGTKVGILAPLAATNVSSASQNVAKDAATAGTEERKITDTTSKTSMQVDPKTLPDKKDPPADMKDTAPKHVSVDNLPILSPRQKLLLKKDFLSDGEVIKVLGDDFQAMAIEPKRLKELEDHYQTFADGLGMDKTPYLSYEALLKLGTIDVKSLAVLAFNNQNDRVGAEIKLASVMKANPNLKLAM